MGRKRIWRDGKKARKKKPPNKQKIGKVKKNSNNPEERQFTKKKKKSSYKFDWVTWNRSLITAHLKDIKNVTRRTKIDGNVTFREIKLEL